MVDDTDFTATIEEIKRVTKPEGKIILCDEMRPSESVQISQYTVLRTLQTYEQLMGLWRLVKSRPYTCVTDNYLFTVWES